MRAILSIAGLLLALACARPAAAYPLAAKAPILSPGACANVVVKLDFTAGAYCLRGALYNSFTAIPGASFTRASSKTCQTLAGGVVTAPAGQPCITDQGFLIEESRTNLLLQSQAMAGNPWFNGGTGGASAADNVALAPDGTFTASKILDTITSGSHVRVQANDAGNIAVTFSVFLKQADYRYATLQLNDAITGSALLTFDLQARTVYGAATTGGLWTGVSGHAEPAAAGWMRCSITATKGAGTQVLTGIYLSPDGSSTPDFSGTGASGVYAWGAQVETAFSASSYIPTTSSSVTRAADAAWIDGVSLPNGGASWAVSSKAYFRTLFTYQALAEIDNGPAGTDLIALFASTGGYPRIQMDIASSVTYDSSGIFPPVLAPLHVRLSASYGAGKISAEGQGLKLLPVSAVSPTVTNRLAIGVINGTDDKANGYIEYINLYSISTAH